MRRYLSVILAALSLASVTIVLGPSSPAGATPWGWSYSRDYATEELGDPWDFSDDADWDVQARLESPGIANANISGGTLNFDVVSNAGGVLIGSAHYGTQSLQWGRSTWLRPIDGSAYDTVSFRLYVPPGTNPPTGGLTYFTCGGTVPSCAHNIPFPAHDGWDTYTLTPGWAGNYIYSLLIIPTAYTGSGFKLDWVRVTRPGGQTSPVSEPIPVVVDPSRRGGLDYASVVRGNAWDFNDASDVANFVNVDSVSFSNGQMRACNTNNDPGIVLALGAPINGSLYHRFTARVYYDGGWSLANAPGGGMNARLLWVVSGIDGYQVSEDIVVYPGWNDIDIDLAVPNVNEQDLGGGAGWAGRTITEVRFDPHEDPGRRCFILDDIKISADDVATPNFPIRFRDDGFTAGTTAEIWLDQAVGTWGGIRIASGINVVAGENVFNWRGGVPKGTYWLWIRLTDPSGHQSSAYASGPLVYAGVPPLPAKTRTPVSAGAPGGTSAVLTNLTMTEGVTGGYITAADSCSALAPDAQTTSNGNFNPGQNIANLSVVPISNGQFCIFNESAVHLLADVQGAFSSSGSLGFTSIAPVRVLDTRPGSPAGANSITRVQSGAPAGTAAALLNLTMTNAASGGYITADKCSVLTPGAKTYSNGNFTPGRDVANLSVVPLDPNGDFCIYSESPVDLIADVQGYFSPGGPLKLTLTPLSRVIDTRRTGMLGDDTVITVPVGAANVPANAKAVLVNLTMTEGQSAGYITADVCPLQPGFQTKSNGNFVAGQNIANLSVVPVVNGQFCLYTQHPVNVLVDVQGYFADDGALKFTASTPLRELDTRQAG